MPRYRLIIEYDGQPFAGWQAQPDEPTVQGALVEAVFRFSGERVAVKGAGRTDTGVHATGQVAHFDIVRDFEARRVRDALNFHLKPAPIAIVDCEEVTSEFDARFSAVRRHYVYRILNRRPPPVLDRHRVWWVPYPMDERPMAEAARALVGRHDFTTFRASQCQAAFAVRSLERVEVVRIGDVIEVSTSARSFLHNQVRSMVGCLKLVGTGRWPVASIADVLAARDRSRCAGLAPPHGLCLTAVDYDILADGANALTVRS